MTSAPDASDAASRAGVCGPPSLPSSSMSSSCSHLLAALKECLLHSDCVLKQGNLPSVCLREHTDELPEECKALRQATFECKRGMVSSPAEEGSADPVH